MTQKLQYIRFLIFCGMLFFSTVPLIAITLPDIIANGMVLKQKSEVVLWGWDEPDRNITINTGWNNKKYYVQTDKNGEWKVYVKTPKAGGPYNIEINGSNTVNLTDILIGEVWLTSGQSNMGWAFYEEKDGLEYIKNIDNRNIRFFNVPRDIREKDNKQFGKPTEWKVSNVQTLKNFSAMSYYFALQLQKELNVPVGIICAAWAGTSIESWISYDLQNSDPLLKKAINRWDGWKANQKQDSIKYEAALLAWEKDSLNGIVKDKVKMPKSVYMIKRKHYEPGSIYNGMISPCLPYSISGLIWYQGENSIEWADEYEYQLSKFIDGWRDSWNINFPVLVGQLTNFNYPSPQRAAVLRDAQLEADKKKDTYVICTIDIGDNNDVHPVDKKPFGKRFSDIALNKVYGLKQFPASYPTVNKWERKDNQIIVSFNNAKGLHTKAGELNDILIWGEDGKKLPAQVSIKGNKLIISNNNIDKPVGTSYAVDEDVNANLYNQLNLPAFPFTIKINN